MFHSGIQQAAMECLPSMNATITPFATASYHVLSNLFKVEVNKISVSTDVIPYNLKISF